MREHSQRHSHSHSSTRTHCTHGRQGLWILQVFEYSVKLKIVLKAPELFVPRPNKHSKRPFTVSSGSGDSSGSGREGHVLPQFFIVLQNFNCAARERAAPRSGSSKCCAYIRSLSIRGVDCSRTAKNRGNDRQGETDNGIARIICS